MELVEEITLLNTHPIRHYRWENGFQTIFIDNPICSVAAYLTLYTVGSASERSHQRGLAHFFEHMMFRETADLGDGDFDRIMSEIGGIGLNAFTTYDTTAYHVNVPSAHLGRVIELEAERMANLRLSPDLIEKERGAVLGEIKMHKDMPSEQLWEALLAASFQSHPYRHPIIGYTEQVEAFKEEDFSAFYGDHYAPNRATVVIAGGFDQQATLELLDKAYGGLTPGSPCPEPLPEEPPWSGTKRVELTHDKITTDYLIIAARSPGWRHPDLPALLLLLAVLTAGQSSPLYRRVVLEGLGTSVSMSQLEMELMMVSPGLIVTEVTLQHGVPAEDAEKAIEEVWRNIRKEGIVQDDLERARNQMRLAYYGSMTNNMGLARQIGCYDLTCGDLLFAERLMDGLDQIPGEMVVRVLQDYLVAPAKIVAIQRPGGGERPS